MYRVAGKIHVIKKLIHYWRTGGVTGLVRAIYHRALGLSPIQAKSFPELQRALQDKIGMEIGGASTVFTKRGIFPVYPIAARIDNCNFGGETIWEGSIKEGQTFLFYLGKAPGRQYLAEATALGGIPSKSYDFVLSSHVLEHTANPILALKEWVRLLKDRGLLIMLLPHRDGTFDHRRPVTTMQHLISDFESCMAEDDLTHMPEILALHDLERDPAAGNWATFKARSERNYENRCFHQHVFDTRLAVKLVDHMGLQIRTVEALLPMHILIVAQKMMGGVLPDNAAFFGEPPQYLRSSPFSSDHL
jgi:SAM-dependent methyltransferase